MNFRIFHDFFLIFHEFSGFSVNSWISPCFPFLHELRIFKIFPTNFPIFFRHTFAIIIKKIVYSSDFMGKIPTLSVKNPRAKFYDDEKHTKNPPKKYLVISFRLYMSSLFIIQILGSIFVTTTLPSKSIGISSMF